VQDLEVTEGAPVVVNMSLTLAVPVPAELALVEEYGLLPATAMPYLKSLARQPLKATAPLSRVVGDLAESGVLCVAAVGNDSAELGDHPLDPRVPAAYPEVVGVAAVDMVGNRAPYSNRCEMRGSADAGIAVYGGVSSAGAEAVHGLFSHSRSGWARWVGTSFATPVISAFVAGWLAGAPAEATPAAAIAYLQSLAGAGAPPADLGCPVIRAAQAWQ
jgi:hypothetical protein